MKLFVPFLLKMIVPAVTIAQLENEGWTIKNMQEGVFAVSLILLVLFATFFWLAQIVDILFRHPQFFESHTHKLIWFLVIFCGNIIGAIWYFLWKRKRIKENNTSKRFRQAE